MRNVFAFFSALLLACGLGLPAHADTPAAGSAATSQKARLDKLFLDLKHERNDKAAGRIAANIQRELSDSGSANIDLLILWSQKAIEAEKYDAALDFLDQITMLAPTYAEGWNRRATLHFMMKNYGKSLADIGRTLQLEPRHFGALAGMARILTETDHKQSALEAWQQVLAIYPMMRGAQAQVSTLSEELAGEAI